MNRNDGALPTVVAIATAPIVLADGGLLAPEGLDRLRGIQFIIQDELRAILPKREDCTPEAGEGGNEIPVRRVAGRRRHRQHRQGTHHRRRTHDDRAFAAGQTGHASSSPQGGAAAGRPRAEFMLIMAVTGDRAGSGGVVDQ